MIVTSFESTHHAMFAEKMFQKAGLEIMTIPTPRQISKSCGISLRIKREDIEEAIRIIERYRIGINGIYEIIDTKKANRLYPE